MNATTRHLEHLRKRAVVIQAVRNWFVKNNFLEVQTPLRCPDIIPEAHINPVQSEKMYLQASPELCMKRLLAKGLDNIFQICPVFRKEERGVRHLPEFTLLEWYRKDKTYLDIIIDCEDLVQHITTKSDKNCSIKYQGKTIDLTPPWTRLTVTEAFEKHASVSLAAALKNNTFDDVLSFEVEPFLGNSKPVFLLDYPAELASLARLMPGSRTIAQRFELYIAGLEIANAFTELTDPVEQKRRFNIENNLRLASGHPALPLPENFLADLDSIDDAAGIALGIDRLVMLFCDAPTIDDVVAFTPESL